MTEIVIDKKKYILLSQKDYRSTHSGTPPCLIFHRPKTPA